MTTLVKDCPELVIGVTDIHVLRADLEAETDKAESRGNKLVGGEVEAEVVADGEETVEGRTCPCEVLHLTKSSM